MTDKITLTPGEAKKRFGELLDPDTRTHKHFEAPEGEWRPAFGPGMTLQEYRLYKIQGGGFTKWGKPKRKR